MAWTTPRTWVAGETVTAALMNQHVRDNLNAIAAVGITGWASYSPSWTSNGTAPSLGNGTLSATYIQIGKFVVVRTYFVYGSTSTGGTGNWEFSLPVTGSGSGQNRPGGLGIIQDGGATNYLAQGTVESTTTCRLLTMTGTGTMAFVTQTSPMTWAENDYAHWLMIYEAA